MRAKTIKKTQQINSSPAFRSALLLRTVTDRLLSHVHPYGMMGLVAAIVVLSGCTTLGPDFKTPESAVAESWGTIDPDQLTEQDKKDQDKEIKPAEIKTQEPMEYRDWWKVFNDPILDALITTAYEQNLTLRAAGVQILEARAQLGIARGNIYPQQQEAAGSVAVNGVSRSANNTSGGDLDFWSADVGLNVGWELDFWGRFRRGIESADASLFTSVANYDDVLTLLLAEVARTYTAIRTFELRIIIARQNVKVQERSLRIAQVRFRGGAVTELDVTQSRTLLANTQALIPALQIGRRQAENALAVLLGMPPGQVRAMLGGDEWVGKIPKPPAEVAVGIPADLLRRRPDVRRAELQAATQSALIGVAQADLYPSFSLLGSIGFASSTSDRARVGDADLIDIFRGNSLFYNFGPSVRWNIFNYGRLKNNVRVQDARLEQLITTYQNTVLTAAQEVEDAMVGFLRNQVREAFLTESVSAAQRSVDLSLIQYREGAVDYQRVLDSQSALADQQDAQTSTTGDVVDNLITMYRALGGGWQVRAGQDFVPAETQEQMRKRTDWGKLIPTEKKLPEELPPAPPPAKDQPLFPRPDW